MRALLRQVGRGEIDDDPPGRERQAGRREGGTHALLDSATALSGRPTSTKATLPEETCTWTSTAQALDALERDRRDARDHDGCRPLASAKRRGPGWLLKSPKNGELLWRGETG